MPTFLPRHMIVWESEVTAPRLILIHITSARIYLRKVKTAFNYLLDIVWTPNSRNIKLLEAGISNTGYTLVQCKLCVNLEGLFWWEFYSCHIFFPGRLMLSVNKKKIWIASYCIFSSKRSSWYENGNWKNAQQKKKTNKTLAKQKTCKECDQKDPVLTKSPA